MIPSRNFKFIVILIWIGIIPDIPSKIEAFQGIMQPAFGARQAGMGGAFQAVGGSVMDLESNPSHLARVKRSKWEFGSSFHFPTIEYYDSYIDQNPLKSYQNRIVESPRAVLPYLGIIKPITENISIAYSYTSRNVLPLDGTMHVDSYLPERSYGTRVSRYMIWPDKHIAGISYHNDRWIIDMDIKYIPWSESFNSSKFRLEDVWVRTPVGLETNSFQFNLNWKNQTVLALGTQYNWNEKYKTRMGYSYGNNIIPASGVSPMLGASIAHHLSLGGSITWNDTSFHIACEYGFPKKTVGGKTSDWTLSHSIFSTSEIHPMQYSYQKSMSVFSIYLGLEQYI
ncbi:OmpP1/FadL family transporter [Leptospira ellinghausenii]|nr:outer membrane protein transport protein [Leptospira ellinghausenii]